MRYMPVRPSTLPTLPATFPTLPRFPKKEVEKKQASATAQGPVINF